MKLVQFGAGNIGRSFIAQIFSINGWEVVFVDIDKRIIDELNKRGEYIVEVKDKKPERIYVRNVRGVYAGDIDRVADEISEADLVATAVGKTALPNIMKPIAAGLIKRWKRQPSKPLDIIICENIKNGAAYFKESLKKYLPDDYPFEELVGLVETSIGKMVPIMSESERKKDPLLVYAEAYNTLIVDAKGFKGGVPDIPQIDAKENMKAWVERKLYIHNLGHAVLAYVSFAFKKGYGYVWEAADDDEVNRATRNAMWESGEALIKKYPEEFNRENIEEHIEDLLERFRNKALGDTLYRVGRDLYRKLSPDDRLVGAVRLCGEERVFPAHIILGISSAFFFRAKDENGNMYYRDEEFFKDLEVKGLKKMIEEVCGIHEEGLILLIEDIYRRIARGISLREMLGEIKHFG